MDAFLYCIWPGCPFEDKIAGPVKSLCCGITPAWSGAGETMRPIWIPDCYNEKFELVYHEEYPLEVPFTRESWNGRMKACRGIGASLTDTEIAAWEQEHRELLAEIAPAEFSILHYGAIAELKRYEFRICRVAKNGMGRPGGEAAATVAGEEAGF